MNKRTNITPTKINRSIKPTLKTICTRIDLYREKNNIESLKYIFFAPHSNDILNGRKNKPTDVQNLTDQYF